jgi:hypothetical protein
LAKVGLRQHFKNFPVGHNQKAFAKEVLQKNLQEVADLKG